MSSRRHRLREILARRIAEIVDLGIADRRLRRVAEIVLVGRADQREIILVGNGEDDAAVPVLEEIGARIVELLLDDDMAALHQAHIVDVVLADRAREHVVDPRSGGVDDQPGPAPLRPRRCGYPRRRSSRDRRRGARSTTLARVRIMAPRSAASRALSATRRASFDPAVRIFERLVKQRLQRLAGRIAAHVERRGRRQQLAAADMIVEEQAEPQQPGRPQPLVRTAARSAAAR